MIENVARVVAKMVERLTEHEWIILLNAMDGDWIDGSAEYLQQLFYQRFPYEAHQYYQGHPLRRMYE